MVFIDDEPSDASSMIKKILGYKLFDDPNGAMWKRSVREIEGEVLCGKPQPIYLSYSSLI